MKRDPFGLLVLLAGISLIFGCSGPTGLISAKNTKSASESQILFADEFDSLNTDVWSSFPSLTPFAGLEGSKTPGEIKVENGILKLSRYASELSGENPASFIRTKSLIDLPETFSATARFRNEFTAFGFGDVFVQVYHHKITIGHRGVNGPADDTYDYPYQDKSFFILTLDVSRQGYTIRIKEDRAGATEQTFSQNVDLSEFIGNSTLSLWGGSNTQSAQYSEIDYVRIKQ